MASAISVNKRPGVANSALSEYEHHLIAEKESCQFWDVLNSRNGSEAGEILDPRLASAMEG